MTNYIEKIAQFFKVNQAEVDVLDHSECDGSANILVKVEEMDYDVVFIGGSMEVFLPSSGVRVTKGY